MQQDTGLARPKSVTGLWRILYVSLGLFFVGLGVFGVFMPGLPTTPFLLLAAFFFARSSSRLHNWLVHSRLFGGFIRDWQQHRGVRPRVKIVSFTLIPLVVASSVYFGRLPWYLSVMLIALAVVGLIVVICLRTVRDLPTPIEPEAVPAPAASEVASTS